MERTDPQLSQIPFLKLISYSLSTFLQSSSITVYHDKFYGISLSFGQGESMLEGLPPIQVNWT